MSRLQEIQARVDAATAGPWEWNEDQEMVSTTVDAESYFGSPVERVVIIITDGGYYPPTDADRPFIAHARQDVPLLLARVRELEAGLRKYGQHTPLCVVEVDSYSDYVVGPCDCGWDDIAAALAGES